MSGATFDGAIALVTGAAGQGIGQAVARRLAAGGARVIVTDSHERRLREVTASIAADFPTIQVAGHVLDVGDLEQIETVVAAVSTDFGPITLLVNNAAVNWPGPVWDYDVDHYFRQFMVNVHGPWYLCRQVMPGMRDAGGGSIVNVSTRAVANGGGFGGEGVYAMTKGALETMTRALAHDGGPHGIRVNTVSTSVVAGTRFIDDRPDLIERLTPELVLGAFPTPDDVAADIAYLLSPAARAVTGDVRSVNSGLGMRM